MTAPTAAELRRELCGLRSGHDRRPPPRRLLDAQDVLLPGGMAVGLAWGALSTPPGAAAPLVGPVALLLVALALKLLLAVGPVVVSSASASWLLTSPVDRRSLLRGRFGAALAASAVGCGLLLAALGPFTGSAAVTASGVPLGVLVGAGAVVLQHAPASVATAQRALRLCVAAAVLLLGLVLVTGRDPLPPDGVLWPLVAVTGIASAATTAAASRRLGRFTRASLTGGTRLVDAARASATWLDPAVLTDLLATRRALTTGRVRSAALRGPRAAAVLRAELVRLRRNGTGVAVWAALALVPHAAAGVLPDAALGAVHLVAAFLATERLAPGLRALARNAALRRAIGGSDRRLRLLHLVIPTAGALIWCAATVPALPVPALAAISAAVAVAVTCRLATRPDLDYSSGVVLDTPFGVVPANLVRQVLRGPGLLLVLVLVQVVLVTG
ncbi:MULTISPECIES: DUF6297 family protein [Actinosynnema]|uniref:DUF6297 family protein n=1 Tax=Actinosynnema TaxID=40566 RepID=UPI0020A5BB54|nr:DUF6297 family protein [Actinosynnema pretiosum]MCP2099035.1 hypothetical protein [Actinosynnema pretiosum]